MVALRRLQGTAWRLVGGFLILFFQATLCRARSYRDFHLYHLITVPDMLGQHFLTRIEATREVEFGAVPKWKTDERQPTTNAPSPSPVTLSSSPTPAPTKIPTITPTFDPTAIPSTSPSESDPFPPNEPPSNPDPWYFNYDLSPTSLYGPGRIGLMYDTENKNFKARIRDDHWGGLPRPPRESDYWVEFSDKGFGTWESVLGTHDPLQNKCSSGSLQSPIDLRDSGAVCREHHEVRSRPGNFRVTGGRVQKRIESNKLRLIYERRPCSDLSMIDCQQPDPPKADFPYGWPGFADTIHIDFKIPSEHTINTVNFDGEMQIYHIHAGRRRLVAQSVLIRATPSGYNYYFQEAIRAFQSEYDKNLDNCRRRNLSFNTTSPFEDFLSWAKGFNDQKEEKPPVRKFEGGIWDPNHKMLIPTIYFYRYDGSLTEPPCGEFVTWFVADEPMVISIAQLDQLKRILFTNVDSNCRKTSVQFRHSVARPTQPNNNRAVSICTSNDFGPDM